MFIGMHMGLEEQEQEKFIRIQGYIKLKSDH